MASDGEPGYDRSAMDAVEMRFWREIWQTPEIDVAERHGIELRRFGPVQATLITGLPRARSINLVLGATAPDAVEGGHLAAALDWAEPLGVDYCVPVTPGLATSAGAEELLLARGYELGYGWMKFVRGDSPPDSPEPGGVEVFELGAGEGERFSAIAAEGFGLPSWARTLFGDLPGRDGWHCYVAEVDGEVSACASMLVEASIAELGVAATIDSARGRGCQQALLRSRVLDASTLGCGTIFAETGERLEGRPAGSYRNILRAGFREAYVRPNWQLPG